MFIGSFVMEKLDNTRVIVFGGAGNDANSQSSRVYLLDISISRVVCRLGMYNIECYFFSIANIILILCT